MPAMISGMKRTRKLLAAMTIRVASGRSAPRPANRVANVGMTFQRITPTTTEAITTTAIGYVIANFTWLCSLTAFSMYVARRWRIASRMPPASPAAIMFVNNASNAFGCFFIASARDAPPSTLARVARMTSPKFLSSRLRAENLEALHERQARADHDGKLASEDSEVLGADCLGSRLLDRLHLDRIDLRDLNLLTPQRGNRRVHRVRDALAGHRPPGA